MSMERSLDTVRVMAGLGDCTKFGGVNLGIMNADGAGVGRGGNEGLLGAVGMSPGASLSCIGTGARPSCIGMSPGERL